MADRVLVLGLDGGTFDVFRPLMEAGKMPNLAALARRAAAGPLESTEPYITPTAWSTFLTGCDPWKHGVFDYRYFDTEKQQIRLHHAGRLRQSTLYDAVSQSGGDVVSLNLPMTYPPRAVEHDTHGSGHRCGTRLIVGGLDSPSTEATLAPYPEFNRRLKAAGIRLDLDPVWRRRPRTLAELSTGVTRSAGSFAARADAADLADEMTDWRLMVVQFQVLDSFQHFCWSFLGIDAQSNVPAEWVAVARKALTALDRSLGRLLELADRRGAAVVGVSDHGFGPFRQQVSLPEVFRRRGLLEPAPIVEHLRFSAACLGRNLRKWLHRRAGKGSTASVDWSLHSVLPCNWKRSRVVALHGNLAGLIYLNTPERFGEGPVRGAAARRQTLAETTASLLETRHPETQEPLFEKVLLTEEHCPGEAVARMLPDLVAIPAPGFHTRTRLDGVGKLLRSEAELSGTHRREGVLVVDAPGVIPGACSAQLRDVAPTILSILGLAPLAECDGRVLTELFLAPAHAVSSRDPEHRQLAKGSTYRDEETAQIESRLRALGYMD